jgi:hypothetical protein
MGYVAYMRDRRGVYRVLVGKPEGKRPLGRTRHRGEDNSKTDLHGAECCCTDWIDPAQDRDIWQALVNVAMNLQVP